jgi:hypothetical protein
MLAGGHALKHVPTPLSCRPLTGRPYLPCPGGAPGAALQGEADRRGRALLLGSPGWAGAGLGQALGWGRRWGRRRAGAVAGLRQALGRGRRWARWLLGLPSARLANVKTACRWTSSSHFLSCITSAGMACGTAQHPHLIKRRRVLCQQAEQQAACWSTATAPLLGSCPLLCLAAASQRPAHLCALHACWVPVWAGTSGRPLPAREPREGAGVGWQPAGAAGGAEQGRVE